MSQPSFSIIIPHYHIPDLLMRCLDSIPVRDDIQVIVVDDCSPEVDTYLLKYPALSRPFLELYHTPIGGSAGRARNIGMDHARGKWLIFIDADDFFVKDIDAILEAARDRTEDILFHNYTAVKNSDLKPGSSPKTSTSVSLIVVMPYLPQCKPSPYLPSIPARLSCISQTPLTA